MARGHAGDALQLNHRRFPATDTCDPDNPVPSETCFVAKRGEVVEFLVIGMGNDMHTFHLHGHNWADTRTGYLDDSRDETTRLIDNKTVGPADSFGFQVLAGEQVGAGSWMLHCHVQSHSDLGMTSYFHVLDDDGNLPRRGGGHDHRA